MSDDHRLRGMAQRIEEHLVDAEGQPAPSGVVEEVVAEKSAEFEDAPVQEFVPLLIENKTRDELHQRGLGVDWAAYEADTDPAGDRDTSSS